VLHFPLAELLILLSFAYLQPAVDLLRPTELQLFTDSGETRMMAIRPSQDGFATKVLPE
jgi:hypothetical protein